MPVPATSKNPYLQLGQRLLKRALAPWEIRARRRNAQKSSGPRTAKGKMRSALNSWQQGLCTEKQELLLRMRGDHPRELRALLRNLIVLLRPEDEYLQKITNELAELWCDKLAIYRSRPKPFRYDLATWTVNRDLESKLEDLIKALSFRTRKWHYRLARLLRVRFSSTAELRMAMEARMPAFRRLAIAAACTGRMEDTRTAQERDPFAVPRCPVTY